MSITNRIADPDYLGERDYFRKYANSFVEKVVSDNKWFSFGKKIDDRQLDILRIKNSEGISLGRMLYDAVYTEECELDFLIGIYKYLMRNYMCYYEAPVVVKDSNLNGFKNSYNKNLVTSNIWVLAKWLDISYENANKLYGEKLSYDDDTSNLIPYYKLYIDKNGVHKVTNSRKELDLSIKGTRLIPVFALKTGVNALYEKLQNTTYDIVFSKDSGQERTMNVTFNMEKIRSFYSDNNYILKATECWYDGDFDNNPNLERGYIRVFEMGSSIYDSPTRSINYARILTFEEAEPDLSYINIDLNTVLDKFKDTVKYSDIINKEIEEVVNSLDIFDVGISRLYNNSKISNTFTLGCWADSQYTLLSTIFLRKLALFMLGNPQWFDNYTGEPYVSQADKGYTWEEEDDLEIG